MAGNRAGRPEYRKSQGIVPFGVGAIQDFPEDSLMAAGLDMWPVEYEDGARRALVQKSTRVTDGRLARRLTANLGHLIRCFYAPIEAPEEAGFAAAATLDESKGEMPFVRFPRWHFCPRCRVMAEVPWNTSMDAEILSCSNPARRLGGEGKTCDKLPKYQRSRLVPIRFVAACPNGHIMDFPWWEWAHSKSKNDCTGRSSDLYFYSVGEPGLAGVYVECNKCKSRRSMAGSFTDNALSQIWPRCPGERPWFGPGAVETQCTHVPRTVQRGASNGYFPKTISSILIPPYSERVQQIVDDNDTWEIIENLPTMDGGSFTSLIAVIAKQNGLDAEALERAAREKLDIASEEAPSEVTEHEYRLTEYNAFLGTRPPLEERHDFDIMPVDISEFASSFGRYFKNVVLVRRLRETRVLTGFSRIVPPGEEDAAPASLSLARLNWLPAMEVRGEGIFLTIRRDKIEAWLAGSDKPTRRAEIISQRLNERRSSAGLSDRAISPEFLAVHTLAHLVIRQLAFDSGYDSTDLKERIYVGEDEQASMCGLLIYTASGDSEGSMGGLVRQGRPGRLESTISAAIINSQICSSDPLCIESEGQGISSQNLAACHACALLPETACEEGNILLDRALVVGLPTDSSVGLFGDME